MELWLRDRIISFAYIIIRVPPLFVIDELLRVGLGGQEEPMVLNVTDYGYSPKGHSVVSGQNWTGEDYNAMTSPYTMSLYQLHLMTALKILARCLGCVAALCAFMLRTEHLIIVYHYLVSVGIIFVSYWSNVNTIEAITTYLNSKENGSCILVEVLNLQFGELMSNGPGLKIIQNYIFQSLLAQLFCYIRLGPRHPILEKIISFSFTVPSHVGIDPLPISFMTKAPIIAALVPLSVCKFLLWSKSYKIWETIYLGYQLGRTFLTNFGLSALAETQWTRLHVPSVLRTFWILRVTEQIFQILSSSDYDEESFNYYMMIKTLMVNGCETLTAVLGMTSVISVICHYIGSFFHWVLLIDEEDEKSLGTVSAMLFYILALQTGLTSLDKENRLLKLCRNLCLLFTAVLHFVHNIVNPLLMSLSASHNPALHRHIRALTVCVFLIVFPVWLLAFLWSYHSISTWLLAVTVFSIEVVVNVLVSLAIYSLFLYDAYRKSFWDELDDWVYIIRSFGNTVEFAFGLILFFNGFWILVFEAGGTIRAFMMCVHAYFNLWCEAKAGWSIFMKRRQAVIKINSLPKASKQQLREHADVCAICYEAMETAKMTKCNHFFHGVCLRKWLYVQDVCPLCHEIMYKVGNKRDGDCSAAQENHDIQERERPSNHGNIHEGANTLLNGNHQREANSSSDQENREEDDEIQSNHNKTQAGASNLLSQNYRREVNCLSDQGNREEDGNTLEGAINLLNQNHQEVGSSSTSRASSSMTTNVRQEQAVGKR